MFGRKKNYKVVVNCSRFEWEQIKINAAERTLPVSDYLRLLGANQGTGTKRAFRQQGRAVL